MEVCGGQTHAIVKFGIDELLPEGVTLVHGPGCPVCVTPLELIDKAIEIAVAARRDLLLLRRHAARARHAATICSRSRREGGDVRDRLLAARRARDRAPAIPERAGRLLRRRLRDDGAGQRDGGLSGRATRRARTSRCSSRTCWCRRRWRRSSSSPDNRVQGFLAAGHVCTIMGFDGVRAARRRSTACRSSSPASSRSTSCRASTVRAAARGGPRRSREPVRALGAARGQPARRRSSCARSSSRAAQVARHRRDPAERPRPCGRVSPTSTPRRDSALGARRRKSRASASAGLILQGVARSRTSARPSARRCTPEHPLGATMVSSEGACAAYYRYRGVRGGRGRVRASDGQRRCLVDALSCPVPVARRPARSCSRTAAAAG